MTAELLASVVIEGAEGRVYPEGYNCENAPYVKVGAENDGTVGNVVTPAAWITSEWAGRLPSRTTAIAT